MFYLTPVSLYILLLLLISIKIIIFDDNTPQIPIEPRVVMIALLTGW